jgi:hypothetical protein
MVTRNVLRGLGAAAVVTALVTAPTHAQTLSNVNHLSFNRPVALPGVTLVPGTYTFEIVNPTVSTDIVRVSDKTSRRVYFTGFTRRVDRPQNLLKGQLVTLGESIDGAPPRIQAWYPMHSSGGRQFLY